MEQLNFGITDGEESPEVNENKDNTIASDRPLAVRMRPRNLDEYVGQQHLLGPGKLLRRAIDADRFTSIILSGPPGTGKTSLAELIALRTDNEFVRMSGVTSSVADLRKEIATAIARKRVNGRRTIIFVDELHRFSKSQQDSLLPDVENGNIRLIGATTHNPQFYIIGALLSRSLAFRLEPLKPENIRTLLERCLIDSRGLGGKNVVLTDEVLDFFSNICEGDARRSLTALELAALTTPPNENQQIVIGLSEAEESIQRRLIVYGDDDHYDTASAFIKSMRGSDPDAAVYWLAKMLHAGEDIRFIARRIVIFASEDIGNADPRAISVAVAAMQAVEMIGMPEAKLILSQAVTYCATAPKSNASCTAIGEALEDVENERVQPVPVHLRDSNSNGSREAKKQAPGYKYPHNFEGNHVRQEYMGVPKIYYRPGKLGYEDKIRQRLEIWRNAGVIPPENVEQS